MTKQLLMYLEPTRAIFYHEDLKSMREVIFPSDVLADLEVVNKEKLESMLITALQTYQLPPQPLSIILSTSQTFDQDITNVPENDRLKFIQQYLDLVPFQENCSHIYSIGKKAQLVVANNTLIEIFLTILKKQQFAVEAIIPYSIVTLVYPQFAQHINLPAILSHIETLNQYSLVKNEYANTPNNSTVQAQPTHSNKRLYLLIGVFVVLIAVFVILLVITNQPTHPSVRTPSMSTQTK